MQTVFIGNDQGSKGYFRSFGVPYVTSAFDKGADQLVRNNTFRMAIFINDYGKAAVRSEEGFVDCIDAIRVVDYLIFFR
ncbi:hypothetical protein DSM101010T_15880 [Desulfovibrio subterraneus]|uniref:Uncharacterized protein n=1 Tax=Desulfovibrio subterraneus TaxID=2718620 RepID=A0A7J0BHJ4_9BACT|nr:hypothetical protein DSM101010T_15880 [Desulfovibrio subterraneus]